MPSPARARAGAKTPGPSDPGAGGASGLAREQVSEIQRQRILAAMAEVCAERGVANVTVAHIVARAGISRRTFYELFADREECFLAAFEEGVARAGAAVVPAYTGAGRWRERMRAGLAALLGFLEEDPGMGRLLFVEALGAGPAAHARRERVLRAAIEAVDGGRAEASRSKAAAPLTAEGVVGGVCAVIHARLQDPRSAGREPADPLTALLGPLMAMVVLPYQGAAAAARELARPAPKTARGARRARRDPLEGLDMRLTYRTVRVLMAVGASPGASNRQVAQGAGISDQGQMSKLLARLESLGLISNSGEGPAKGTPNAWTLTPRGADVEQAIRAQTTERAR